MLHEKIRRCIFRPYRKGYGPTFCLTLYDTGETRDGKWRLAYRLTSGRKTIFEGDDFYFSPLHAIDSDSTVASLMGFLTLRPGDTDREYFENYTPTQLEFCEQHAEALGCAVCDRFGYDN